MSLTPPSFVISVAFGAGVDGDGVMGDEGAGDGGAAAAGVVGPVPSGIVLLDMDRSVAGKTRSGVR